LRAQPFFFPIAHSDKPLVHYSSSSGCLGNAAVRDGIAVGDVQDVIETAIGGKNLTTAIDGRQHLTVRVRYAPDFRQDPEELRNSMLVTASNGAQISPGQVADLGAVMGPFMISSENSSFAGVY
jgi:Cu(I)/Ag(I) efflux system membrane protein CusA/SilA